MHVHILVYLLPLDFGISIHFDVFYIKKWQFGSVRYAILGFVCTADEGKMKGMAQTQPRRPIRSYDE